jgi:hypothetical protein
VIDISTVAELDQAIRNLRGVDLDVRLHTRLQLGNLPGRSGREFHAPGRTITVTAASPDAGLDFSTYQTAWPAAFDPNGIGFNCRDLVLRGLWIGNYQGSGAAIKLDIPGTATIENCHAENVSSTLRAQRPDGDRGVAAVFGHRVGKLVTRGNTYKNCCTSHQSWAHVYYIRATQAIDVDDAWYDGCNSIWALIGENPQVTISAHVQWARGEINTWDRGTDAPAKQIAPVLATLRGGRGVWSVDHVLGTWDYLWNVAPDDFDPARHQTHADTSQAKLQQGVAIWLNHGNYSVAQWRAAGFEQDERQPGR